MFYHIISNESSRLLKIDNIGFSHDPSNNRFGPGKRNLYLIHYVFGGKGYFNGHTLSAGQGFLIKPGTNEYYYPDNLSPWSFLWVTSQDPAIEEIFQCLQKGTDDAVFNYDYTARVLALCESIKQNHNTNYSAAKILEIFLNLFNNHSDSAARFEKNSDMYFEYAANYIKANIYRPIRVSELVDTLGITQPYLYKIFIEKCRMSPKQYIDHCKISAAKSMIAGFHTSIADIGRSLGFEDQFVFSRFFKKNVGVCPSEYKKAPPAEL